MLTDQIDQRTLKSLMRLEQFGTPDEINWMSREVARAINKAEFTMNKRLMADKMGGVWTE